MKSHCTSAPKRAFLSLTTILLLSQQKGSITMVQAKSPLLPSFDRDVSDNPPGSGAGLVIGSDPIDSQDLTEPAVFTQCPSLNASQQQFVQVCIDSAMTITASRTNTSKTVPPDPHGAVGPKSLIAVTNIRIECPIWSTCLRNCPPIQCTIQRFAMMSTESGLW
jgi:hypothetical protein